MVSARWMRDPTPRGRTQESRMAWIEAWETAIDGSAVTLD